MKTTTPHANFTPSTTSSSRKQLSAFDVLFIGLIGLCLAAGIQLSRVNNRPSPFGVSVLFGSAISLLTYYFLGGIKQDEATLKTGLGNATTITLGGSVAALVGSTLISNFILEKQMTLSPSDHLLIIDHKGEIKKSVKVSGQDYQLFPNSSPDTIKVASASYLSKEVREVCYQGKGFCKEKPVEIRVKIDPRLNKGFATVCEGHEWERYPLIVAHDLSAVRVTTVANQLCPSNTNFSWLKISVEDAKVLGVNEQDIVSANITSLLSSHSPTSIYKVSQK